MARRLPSQPPVLPGFSYVHVLGSGGFADVFLYEQNMPRRQVAVKVMLSEVVNDQVRQMFQAEANLMAQLSAHPSILTVYQASVSSDGRPYLVMELCSASLSERYRREPLPVPEVLRIGIKIGSAVETAHQAGVLHRDIKPSNILLTAYGHPVLSDFGIASTLTRPKDQESVGLSIPWSAPEVLLDETPGTVASEVWSLAATVYSLLAGRSPFEIPGRIELLERSDGAYRPCEAAAHRAPGRAGEPRGGAAPRHVAEAREPSGDRARVRARAAARRDRTRHAADHRRDRDGRLGARARSPTRRTAPGCAPSRTGSSPSRDGARRRRRPVESQPYAPVGTVREGSGPSGPFSKSRTRDAGHRIPAARVGGRWRPHCW